MEDDARPKMTIPSPSVLPFRGGRHVVSAEVYPNIDAFFLEYDSGRAGGFEPLRFIKPGNQKVVLGLVTSKTGELDNSEGIKARIHEAAQFMNLDQICLCTQCGFAFTEEGNALTETQQQAKLKLVVQAARERVLAALHRSSGRRSGIALFPEFE